jgi:hypothetical protein
VSKETCRSDSRYSCVVSCEQSNSDIESQLDVNSICACVCVCVCEVRERETERGVGGERERERKREGEGERDLTGTVSAHGIQAHQLLSSRARRKHAVQCEKQTMSSDPY